MLIAFTHTGKAFLPETDAYRIFFERMGVKTAVLHPREINRFHPDIEWRFMGLHFHTAGARVLIHEYASASLPPLRRMKDMIKKNFNIKPGYRLYLNRYVQEQLSFRDSIPFGYRDMGIYPETLSIIPTSKVYDFIYCGSVSRDMQIERLLDCFTRLPLNDKTVLVLSKNYQALQQHYKQHPNILFKGPVPQNEVSGYIRQARYALNYKPDIAPHNQQTSTKFLEYAACGIPVITTDFAWVHQFQQRYGGEYFFLNPDLSNLTWENITGFRYTFPEMKDWTWEQQIKQSGVVDYLRSVFPQLKEGVGSR